MKWNLITALVLMLAFSGCAKINPRMDQEIQNQDGKIEELKNNQNGVNLELGKLRQESQVANSKLDEFQQGMINMNAAISKNENSGIQILQGDGALILIFSITVIGMLLYHYRNRAVTSEKSAEILAQQVALYDDAELNDEILKAAMHTNCEQHVFNLLKKQ